jgi:hypothetical protein
MERAEMAKKIALLLDYNDNYAKTMVDGVAKFSIQGNWRFINKKLMHTPWHNSLLRRTERP